MEQINEEINKTRQFRRKKDALIYLNYIKDDNYRLYSIDINASGIRKFIITTPDTIYNCARKRTYCIHEHYEKNELVKLHLDIDMTKKNGETQDDFKKLMFDVIGVINEELLKHKIVKPSIIILTASTSNKFSSHIVYKNVIFEDIYAIKRFLQSLNSSIINSPYLDLGIYRTGSFRMLWCSKIDKNNPLELYQGLNYSYSEDKDLFFDTLVRKIPSSYDLIVMEQYIPKTKSDTLNKSDPGSLRKLQPSIEKLRYYVDLLDSKRADSYSDWITIGLILHNCDSSDECLNLWISFSIKSSKFKGRDDCLKRWISFSTSKTGYSIASLIYFSKIDTKKVENTKVLL